MSKLHRDARVELRLAFAWDCPECGREQFARAIVPEMSPENIAELRDDHGIAAWDEGLFCHSPPEVTCAFCGLVFAADDFGCDGD